MAIDPQRVKNPAPSGHRVRGSAADLAEPARRRDSPATTVCPAIRTDRSAPIPRPRMRRRHAILLLAAAGNRPGRPARPSTGRTTTARAPSIRSSPIATRSARRSARGDGYGLPRRAAPAGPPPGGAEADQAGDGLAQRPGPLRVGAPGPGPDGAPQHRPRPRRRHDRRRPPVLRHGAGQGHPDHRVLRRPPPRPPRPAGAVPPGLLGGAARRTRRGSSTATSSPPTSWSSRTTTGRSPR